jgi:hypothetical protein
VNAPPIEDAVISAVKTDGRPVTFAEICEALKTVAEWKDKTVEDAIGISHPLSPLPLNDYPKPEFILRRFRTFRGDPNPVTERLCSRFSIYPFPRLHPHTLKICKKILQRMGTKGCYFGAFL